MTRAVVFLAATLVAASLGAVARNSNSGGGSTARADSSTSNRAQPSAAVSSSAQNFNPAEQKTKTAASDSADGTAHAKPPAATKKANTGVQDTAQDEESTATLPQTSTILPLLGLIGLGSLVAGLFARR